MKMDLRSAGAEAALLLLGFAALAAAHVELDLPNGAELIDAGSVYTVTWQVAKEHNLLNWDLWYSTTGAGGPWIPIATDLPPGDPSSGSIHTFDWTVPATPSAQVRVRVQQDNAGEDYEDSSDADLSILMGPRLITGSAAGGGSTTRVLELE